ncbi:HXXEE domain-containing protein [Arthrobacter sp. KNU40]|uniref:HXXEE domain-containing protein n=1 Tax=Arthrobacter sp. KNU40 TaxID=3447965 RepID=UPI003F60E96A
MTAEIVIWISVALFIVHEFEEIVFVKPWLSRCRDHPRASRQAFWSFRDTSTSTIALLIFEEFVLVGAVATIAMMTGRAEVFAGLLIPYALHLVVHILEVARVRLLTPSFITAVITLPWYIYAIPTLTKHANGDLAAVALWGGLFVVLMFANFALIYWLRPRIERFLWKSYAGGADGEAARGIVPDTLR